MLQTSLTRHQSMFSGGHRVDDNLLIRVKFLPDEWLFQAWKQIV